MASFHQREQVGDRMKSSFRADLCRRALINTSRVARLRSRGPQRLTVAAVESEVFGH
jgi:hypothetical protein